MKRVLCSLVLVVLTIALVACGSSYTKKDFISRANGICTDTLRATRSIVPAAAGTGKDAALAEYANHLLPIIQREAQQLRTLKRPPQTDRENAALTSYLTALAQRVQSTRDLMAAARRGDEQGIAAAEAALRTNPAATLAVRYGLRACGTPSGTAA